MNHPGTSARGFTLIELLVVISIIGMLSSVVLVALQSAKQKGNFGAALTFSHTLTSALYTDSLVFLNFDSMSGMTASDLIANNTGSLPITAVAVNGASLVSDTTLYNRGSQLSIPTSGTSPLILTVPGINTPINSNTFTFALWYKPMPDTTGLTATSPLIGWDANSAGARLGVNYADTNGNVNGVYFSFPNSGGAGGTTASVSLPSGQWAYIAMAVKYNPTTGNVASTLYVNGKIASTFSAFTTPYTPSSPSQIEIGGFCCKAGITSGYLDDVAIYGVAATTADIRKMYAEGARKHGLALAD